MSGKEVPLNNFVTRSQVIGRGGALKEKHFSCDTIIDKSCEIMSCRYTESIVGTIPTQSFQESQLSLASLI